MWLPKPLYEAIPYFYIVAGLLFVAGASLMMYWRWDSTLFFVFSIICLISGTFVFLKRRHFRKLAGKESDATPGEEAPSEA